jgi:ArsR family transcriptional regulator
MDTDICVTTEIHPDVLARVEANMPDIDELFALEELFRTLGDSTRIRVVSALRAAELCVCDLAELLRMSQSATSHQLRVLRNMRLVKYRREGRKAYYSLDDEHIETLLDVAFEHVRERK